MEKNLFYKKGVDICSAKSMFNFINEHYTYWTMNSWNLSNSIANNVKLYNLGLDGDWGNAMSYLFDESDLGGIQYELHDMIKDWEADHPGYVLGFNGRMSGYLVLYNKNDNKSILPAWLIGFNTYEEWKDYIKVYYGSNVKDWISELRYYTQLIQSFDRLCDDMRALTNEYSKMDYEADKKAAEAEE